MTDDSQLNNLLTQYVQNEPLKATEMSVKLPAWAWYEIRQALRSVPGCEAAIHRFDMEMVRLVQVLSVEELICAGIAQKAVKELNGVLSDNWSIDDAQEIMCAVESAIEKATKASGYDELDDERIERIKAMVEHKAESFEVNIS